MNWLIFRENIAAENFYSFALHPCLEMCVNMADPTKIFFVNYIVPGQGVLHQIHRNRNLQIMFSIPKNSWQFGSADRQSITAKYFRTSIGQL